MGIPFIKDPDSAALLCKDKCDKLFKQPKGLVVCKLQTASPFTLPGCSGLL